MKRKRRGRTLSTCLGCKDFRYKKVEDLVVHLSQNPSCVSKGGYWVCQCCRKYASESYQNFHQHLERSNNNCLRFFDQSQNAQRAIMPRPPDDNDELLHFDDDIVDDICIDAHNQDHVLTHVYKESGKSQQIQLVQFFRNDNTDQLGKPSSTLHYTKGMEHSKNLETAMLRQAATVSSKSNGTFGSVLKTLPGMNTASYVLHDDTLQGLHSHGDVHIRNDESEDEFSDNGDDNTDDHEEEASGLIRIVNEAAISIENEDRSFENSGIDDSMDGVEVPFPQRMTAMWIMRRVLLTIQKKPEMSLNKI